MVIPVEMMLMIVVGKDCSNGNIDGGSDSENDNGT